METIDSLVQQTDLYLPINKIAENTEPLTLIIWNLSWWSFVIACLSLLAGVAAAIYSYMGYRFQRISADRLEKLIPGQISYYEVVCSIINSIFDIEALFFGKLSYKSYPTKLILSNSKLPDDLINLEKYEKNKICYDEAFKLKVSWRNYNIFLDNFMRELNNYTEQEVASYAGRMLLLSKSMITLIQKFEIILSENNMLEAVNSTNERISYFILDRFFEFLSNVNSLGLNKLDTKRGYLTKKTTANYVNCSYIPNLLNIDDYFNSYHVFRLNMLNSGNDPDNNREKIIALYNKVKEGYYDRLGNSLVLPPNTVFSSLDIHEFKNAFINYIEPLILGYKRYEYSIFLK